MHSLIPQMQETFFFDSWRDLLQIAITVPIIYLFVIVAVRVVGKRSTSQMNNFDWIVTVAIGSIAGAGIMRKGSAIVETILAISLLLLLQWLLTTAVRTNKSLQHLVKARPTLLVHEGKFIEQSMRQERITQGEVLSALRVSGLTAVNQAKWVILEPDASLSVIPMSNTTATPEDLEMVETPPR